MAYASVTDVEARLGFAVQSGEAQSLEVFLSDFSIYVDSLFAEKGITIPDSKLELLKVFIAQKGVNHYFSGDLIPGASTMTNTSGDTSSSVSFSAAVAANIFQKFSLTSEEKRLLGLSKAKIVTFYQDSRTNWGR
jgi:hypothetical protein